jgi:hypothetical protein
VGCQASELGEPRTEALAARGFESSVSVREGARLPVAGQPDVLLNVRGDRAQIDLADAVQQLGLILFRRDVDAGPPVRQGVGQRRDGRLAVIGLGGPVETVQVTNEMILADSWRASNTRPAFLCGKRAARTRRKCSLGIEGS